MIRSINIFKFKFKLLFNFISILIFNININFIVIVNVVVILIIFDQVSLHKLQFYMICVCNLFCFILFNNFYFIH